MPIKAVPDIKFRSAKPKARPYKIGDEAGLFMLVSPSGSKVWRFKYRVDAVVAGGIKRVEKALSIGPYPQIDLVTARQKRDEAREGLANGKEPVSARQAAKLALENCKTFEQVALEWFEVWSSGKSKRHVESTKSRLERDVYPGIGRRDIVSLKTGDFISLAQKIEKRGASVIARKMKQKCSQIMEYAVARDHIQVNPAVFKTETFLKPHVEKNQARLAEVGLPELLRKIEIYSGTPLTRYAMKFMALTFVRTAELIGARWDEINLDKRAWTIPAHRMKGTVKEKRQHIVPLAKQTVLLLTELRLVSGHSDLLFPGERANKSMSNGTILVALKRMGYAGAMTGHGFRGVASTMLNEMGFVKTHVDSQLAHRDRDQVSAAYNHAEYLTQRTVIMQAWADKLDELRATGTVLPFKKTGS